MAIAVAALACAIALLPGAAIAQEPLPDGNAGTDQYIEPVPDAGGDRRAEPGSDGRRGRLPQGTRDALPPGEEGRILGRIATDPGTGAPSGGSGSAGGGSGGEPGAGGGSGGEGGGGDGARPPVTDDADTGLVSALTSAVTDSESRALPILLLAVAGMALAAGFVRLRRRS